MDSEGRPGRYRLRGQNDCEKRASSNWLPDRDVDVFISVFLDVRLTILRTSFRRTCSKCSFASVRVIRIDTSRVSILRVISLRIAFTPLVPYLSDGSR